MNFKWNQFVLILIKKALDAVWLSFFIAIFAKSIGGLCSQNFGPLVHITVFAITTDKTDDIRIMNQTDIALQIAIQAHSGQTDRQGEPYILHPLAVGLAGETDEQRAAGFLHDVVEDSDFTFDDLLNRGISSGVVNALRLLTHDKHVTYQQYIQNIIDSGNPIALSVKYNDLQHNYARSKEFPDLQTKYADAIDMVKSAIDLNSQTGLYHQPEGVAVAVFAGGCFWGVQHEFGKIAGVMRSLVGYTGGEEELPTYADVRTHNTRHVESVLIEYAPQTVSYTELCHVFFEIHDPAQTDGVGSDIGPQYRSCIFYADGEQQTEAQSVIADLCSRGYVVNTLLLPLGKFWTGEEFHQRYYEKTGGEPYCHIRQRKF